MRDPLVLLLRVWALYALGEFVDLGGLNQATDYSGYDSSDLHHLATCYQEMRPPCRCNSTKGIVHVEDGRMTAQRRLS